MLGENERELSLGLGEVSLAILTKSLRDNATAIKTEHKKKWYYKGTKCEPHSKCNLLLLQRHKIALHILIMGGRAGEGEKSNLLFFY